MPFLEEEKMMAIVIFKKANYTTKEGNCQSISDTITSPLDFMIIIENQAPVLLAHVVGALILALFSIYTHCNTLKKKAFGKHCGKR